jgi:hypothetical protein
MTVFSRKMSSTRSTSWSFAMMFRRSLSLRAACVCTGAIVGAGDGSTLGMGVGSGLGSSDGAGDTVGDRVGLWFRNQSFHVVGARLVAVG